MGAALLVDLAPEGESADDLDEAGDVRDAVAAGRGDDDADRARRQVGGAAARLIAMHGPRRENEAPAGGSSIVAMKPRIRTREPSSARRRAEGVNVAVPEVSTS